MSTPADVESAILALAAGAFYPSGVPADTMSTAGMPVKLHRGWPQRQELDLDVRASTAVAHITVNRKSGMVRSLPGFTQDWQTMGQTVPGIGGTVTPPLVTFTGTATQAQMLGLLVSGVGYGTLLPTGSTAMQAASALSAVINAGGLTTADTAQNRLNIKNMTQAVIKSGPVYTMQRQTALLEAGFLVSVFAPSIAARDACEAVLYPALRSVTTLPLADGGWPLVVADNIQNDAAENADVYRSDIVVTTRYFITETQSAGAALFLSVRSFIGNATNPAAIYFAESPQDARAFPDTPVYLFD